LSTVRESTTASDQPEPMVLDHAHLKSLGTHLPVDVLAQLLGFFPEQAQEQVCSIKARLAESDLVTLAREAHSLAGGAANYGAFKLSQLAREIEAACETADATEVERHVKALAAVSEEACASILHWLAARDGRCATGTATTPR
jgi:HPt (histidine-containing phosphotransfer) domain-containing protein